MSRLDDLKYIISKCCEKGYRPIAKSKVEDDKYIVLLDKTIDRNGYFYFNYADENGNLLTDFLPSRKSIYPVTHYQWLYISKDRCLLNQGDDMSNMIEKQYGRSYNNFRQTKTQELVEIENLKKEIEVYKNILKNHNISIPNNINTRVVGIDFDGTLVTNEYPDLGVVKDNAKEVCKRIINSGNQIVIWTCREPLVIKEFLIKNDIPFDAINENTEALKQRWGNDPRKVGVDLFIDDKNIFCNEIDWFEIGKELVRLGYIQE